MAAPDRRAQAALILDASVLYGAADAADPSHAAMRGLLERWSGELVVSAFTAAEADYLIATRLGIDAELAFLDDLASAHTVVVPDPAGLAIARDLCARYRALELGLADASIVVLADRWRTRSIATLDERHFRAVTPLAGGVFELLPADGGPR